MGRGREREAYPAHQHLSLLVDGQRWNVVELKHGQQFGSDPGGLAGTAGRFQMLPNCNHSEPWMNGVY